MSNLLQVVAANCQFMFHIWLASLLEYGPDEIGPIFDSFKHSLRSRIGAEDTFYCNESSFADKVNPKD